MRWQVVIPQKPVAQAKSRLVNGPVFAEAMVRDVITACRDLDLSLAMLGGEPGFGVPQLPDAGGGLSAAVRTMALHVTGPLAVLMGDLPCLRATELRAALVRAADVPFGVVADAAGTGTTMLTALVGSDLRTSYGAGSFGRHLALGAADLHGDSGLRRDVDTIEDLAAAVELGVGEATRNALTSLGMGAVHLGGP